MKGAYYSMDDAYKIANFDKVNEKRKMLETENFELTQKNKETKERTRKRNNRIKKRAKKNTR